MEDERGAGGTSPSNHLSEIPTVHPAGAARAPSSSRTKAKPGFMHVLDPNNHTLPRWGGERLGRLGTFFFISQLIELRSIEFR